jgi:hypothetical protein
MSNGFQSESSTKPKGVIKTLSLMSVAALSLVLAGCSTLGVILSGEVVLDSSVVEKEIERGVLNQAGIKVTADCPNPMSGKPGDVRQCLIEDEFGTVAIVKITIQNNEGVFVWEVQ